MKKDLMGDAIWDYYHQHSPQDLLTETSISELDELPVAYLFRPYEEMTPAEQKAMQLARGRVLDVGAGAGCHSLYLQNERGLEVVANDKSEKSVQVCQLQGIKTAIAGDFLSLPEQKFDTILLLMNGTGIFQSLSKIDHYLQKLKRMLASGGQILIDGSDIIYMFDRDEDGGIYIPAEGYYGEVDYILHYKGDIELTQWLYLDYPTLKTAAEHNGLSAELLLQDEYAYLARLF